MPINSVMRIASNQGRKKGTGFVFGDKRHFLTALHNVENANDIQVFPDVKNPNLKIAAKIIRAFKDIDLALLELDESVESTPLRLTPTPSGRIAVYVEGFPTNSKLNPSQIGRLVGPEKNESDLFSIVFDPVPQDQLTGMSGSPVFDDDRQSDTYRQVIGILLRHDIEGLEYATIATVSSYLPKLLNELCEFGGNERFKPDKLQCYVVSSNSDKLALRNNRIGRVVEFALVRVAQSASSGGRRLDSHPIVESISDILASKVKYEVTIKALCEADVVVFDVTNFEPGVMLLLGVRSVARRGVTICSVGGDFAVGDRLDIPFNIKEINFVAHSHKQRKIGAQNQSLLPEHLIADRISEGLQFSKVSEYADNPAYEPVRILHPSSRTKRSVHEQILLLCSYSVQYQTEIYPEHTRLLSYILGDNRIDIQEMSIKRVLDILSPRLVSKVIYEEIRRTDFCLVDWTEWSPNVFFELGVRLACTNRGTVNIIAESDVEIIRELLAGNQSAVDALLQSRPPYEKRSQNWLKITHAQCKQLLDLFSPISYPIVFGQVDDDSASNDDNVDAAYQEMYSQFQNAISGSHEPRLNAATTFNIVDENISASSEPFSGPVYKEFMSIARLLSSSNTSGISSSLYSRLGRSNEKKATEYLLAAWLVLIERYGRDVKVIKQIGDRGLIEDIIEIGSQLTSKLSEYGTDYNPELAAQVMELVIDLQSLDESE
jgi:hypothetical protein